MSEAYEVGPTHPCWKAYGDDDWNGSTFTMWVNNSLAGKHVKLTPPADLPKETVQGVWLAVASTAGYVELKGVTVHILWQGRVPLPDARCARRVAGRPPLDRIRRPRCQGGRYVPGMPERQGLSPPGKIEDA